LSNTILSHQFDNGLVLVAEPMQWLESAAFTWLLPAGAMRDPADQLGLSNFTCEMVQRGCGSRSSRDFIKDLETLGVSKSASVSISHTSYAAAMPAKQIHAALDIYADLICRPHLPEDQLEEGRLVCRQELRAIEDDLAQKVMQSLRRQQYASPYGRNSQGTQQSVEQITADQIQQHYQACYRPNHAILGVAGKIEWESLREHVGNLFADWQPADLPAIDEGEREAGYVHLSEPSVQTHIGVSYPSVPYSNPDYFQARGAVGVLSDGMSSRLFTEVRENRGLCYTVYASCHTLRDRGSIMAYAGTTTERAQETLDVMIAELIRLSEGIHDEELQRLKARVKSALIMHQESSTARSGAIAADWYHLGHVRSIEEIGAIIDQLTCESINAYLADHRPHDLRVATLGEHALEVPLGIS